MIPDHLQILRERLRCEASDPEISAVLFLDRHADILGFELTQGTIDRLAFPVARIVNRSHQLGARQILLFHTHPSGTPLPSSQDMTLTRRLCALLRRQGQRLTDHVILTQSRYFSFRSNGLL